MCYQNVNFTLPFSFCQFVSAEVEELPGHPPRHAVLLDEQERPEEAEKACRARFLANCRKTSKCCTRRL